MNSTLPGEVFKEMTDIFDELLDSLSTLHALSTIHLPVASEKELFRQVMEILVENYGFDKCSVFAVEKSALCKVGALTWQEWESGQVFPQESQASPEDKLFLQTMMGMAVQTGESQVCSDCQQDNIFSSMVQGKKPTSLGSVVSSPIIFGQKAIGAVNVSYPLPDQLNEWQKRLIPVFCRFLGQIITSNRLLNDLEKEVNSRTSQLDSLLDETRRMEQHYQELAMIDDLTGIYNRRFFFLEAKRTLGRAVRHFHPFSLLIVDLDRFKHVNDTYGHAIGDAVLQDVASAMRKILRETDILARTGGEEFAIALPETDAPGTRELAERVLKAVNSLSWSAGGDMFQVTASIGCAHISVKNISNWQGTVDSSLKASQTNPSKTNLSHLLDRLYSEADTAMYIAKRKGGSQIAQLADIE